MTTLRADNLSKRYAEDAAPAVDSVSFAIDPGEVFALIGPSGCGKTTTLRIIAGFERTDGGQVTLGDRVIESSDTHVLPDQRGIGLVFQELALFPHLSVMQNAMFGLQHLPTPDRRKRATEALGMMSIADLADRMPHQLSGGQQQRLAIARSIAPQPRIVLLDEPFNALDTDLRAQARDEIRGVFKAANMAALLVTHDQEEALSFADRIGVMNAGRLLQLGSPQQVYHQPETAFVANFLGRTNLVTGHARGQTAQTPLGEMPISTSSNGEVLLSIRPEHLRMQPATNGQPAGQIISRAFKGHDLTYQIRFGDKQYTVQTDYTCPLNTSDHVTLTAAEPAVVVQPNGNDSSVDVQ